jgi:hypothetical protein
LNILRVENFSFNPEMDSHMLVDSLFLFEINYFSFCFCFAEFVAPAGLLDGWGWAYSGSY